MRKYSVVIFALFILVALLITGRVNQPKNQQVTPEQPDVTGVSTDLRSFYTQELRWASCYDQFECTDVIVPLKYSNPTWKTITIAVIRLKAKNPVGSLILNPGGPGGSGIDYAKAANYVVSKTLINRYDIVGFDPRGVGQSTPVECFNDQQTDEYIAADGSPDSQQEVQQAIDLSKRFAQACQDNSVDLYEYVDTISAARDVDIIRALLGDDKLNWLGKSYGTFLGATYADLFPQKVGRMVLDGVIDPTLSNVEISYDQALGFEDALRRFIADCLGYSDCPLSANTVDQGYQQIRTFIDRLDTKPAVLNNGRVITQAMALIGVLGSLYDKQYGWPQLRADLADAFAGKLDGLAASLDLYISRNPDGTYADNSNDAIAAVNCLDRSDRISVEKTQAIAQQWQSEAPLFGVYTAWSTFGCTYWKAPATGKPKTIHAAGSAKILLVGTTHDPATPYAWAKSLAEQLDNAELLTFDGDGHTAYMQGSSCVDRVVDDYFVTGKAKVNVVCSDGIY